MNKSTTLLLGIAVLGAEPAAVRANVIPQMPLSPDPPDMVSEQVPQDIMTAVAYRAVIDGDNSHVEHESGLIAIDDPLLPPPTFVGLDGPNSPGTPGVIAPALGLSLTPVQNPTASISGSIDLELQTYTWYSDNYGNPLIAPVVEDWLRIVATDLTFSDPDLAFSLPSSWYRIYPDGGFSYSNFGCPQYPDPPWAPGYHQSCSVFANYSESLQGTLAGLDLTISGSETKYFTESTSYDIAANLQPLGGQTAQAPLPGTAALALLGLGVIALHRRGRSRSNAAKSLNHSRV